MTARLQIVDCGDSGVRVASVDADRQQAWRAVHSLAEAVGGRSTGPTSRTRFRAGPAHAHTWTPAPSPAGRP